MYSLSLAHSNSCSTIQLPIQLRVPRAFPPPKKSPIVLQPTPFLHPFSIKSCCPLHRYYPLSVLSKRHSYTFDAPCPAHLTCIYNECRSPSCQTQIPSSWRFAEHQPASPLVKVLGYPGRYVHLPSAIVRAQDGSTSHQSVEGEAQCQTTVSRAQ